MRARPGQRRARDADPVRAALHRADRRPGHEHRRGRGLPGHRRGRGPEPVTETGDRSGSCSCAPATRAAASWPRRSCASTAGRASRSTAPAPTRRGSTRGRCGCSQRPGSTRRGRARSRSTEYLGQPFDYVITVCDQARQVCPVFPGAHESLHWGYEDPAEADRHRGGAHGGLPAGLHPARRADQPVHPARPARVGRSRDAATTPA